MDEKNFLLTNLPANKAKLLKDFLLKNDINFSEEDADYEIRLEGEGEIHEFSVSWILSRTVHAPGKTQDEAYEAVRSMALPITGDYVDDSIEVFEINEEEAV